MTLDDYTRAVVPVIRAAIGLEKDDKSNLARQLRYLYQQALYGFCDEGKKYVSQAAQTEYERLGFTDNITQYSFRHQQKFDKLGRRDGKFHFEHVFTIWMFQQALKRFPPDAVNGDVS